MTTQKTNLVKTIASRAQSVDFWSFGYHLPNPDPVLKRMGKDISAYRELLSDAHVGGCIRRRKAAIKGLEWRITPTGNEKVDEWLLAVFNALPLNKIITEILDATLFGYQALEVTWHYDGQYWQPVAVEGKPQEWFVFGQDNELRLRTKEHRISGVELPEKKFLLATQNASYDNPYGRGDLSLCFWPATFKKGGYKFWFEFTEKYGSPWLIGKHPRTAKQNEVDELADSLEEMIGTAIAAIPDDSSISIVESAAKGASSEVFNQLLSYSKAEIAIAILGQNQTTEADANRASATAGLEVTKDIRDEDAELVASCFNELLKWICELNFTSLEQLPTFELFEQESIDKVQAERDEILHRIGVRFSPQYIARTYNFEEGDILMEKAEQAPQENKGVVDFSESMSKHPIKEIGEKLSEATDPIIQRWFDEAKATLNQTQTLEEFMDKLVELIPELGVDEYARLMSQASELSFMAGRHAVVEEQK